MWLMLRPCSPVARAHYHNSGSDFAEPAGSHRATDPAAKAQYETFMCMAKMVQVYIA